MTFLSISQFLDITVVFKMAFEHFVYEFLLAPLHRASLVDILPEVVLPKVVLSGSATTLTNKISDYAIHADFGEFSMYMKKEIHMIHNRYERDQHK